MTTVTVDQMKDKLLSIEQVTQLLQPTEPLDSLHLSNANKIMFRFEPGWEAELDSTSGTETVNAAMRIDGVERQMTKDAALQAAANIGLQAAYVKRTPSNLIEANLNYHYSGGMGEKEYKALSVGGNIAAFTRPNVVSFSNLELLDHTVEGIQRRYGRGVEIFADYKIQNNLTHTDIRLIVPEHSRTIENSNMNDVPDGGSDQWSAGIHLSNSLIGKKMTGVEAYLFRWWCTNGMTTELAEAGHWSRKTNGQDEMDVYTWARDAVDDVLGGLEGRFDEIQALTALNLSGNTADVLREIFTQHEVPVSQRQTIMHTLLESSTLTMYSVMNAITQAANDPELDPRRADKLMRLGGEIPTATFDTLKARVFREGQEAGAQAPNPYAVATAAHAALPDFE